MQESFLLLQSANNIMISLLILVLNFDLNIVHEQSSAIFSDLIDNSHIRRPVRTTAQVLQALGLLLLALGARGRGWVFARAGAVRSLLLNGGDGLRCF